MSKSFFMSDGRVVMNAYVQGQHHPARSVSRPPCDGDHSARPAPAPAQNSFVCSVAGAPRRVLGHVRHSGSGFARCMVAPWIAPEGAGRSRPGAAHQRAEALLLYPWRVRAACIELLVALDEVGSVGAQPLHEDAAHLAAQVQRDAADPRRPGLPRHPQDLLDLTRVVVDARHQRRDEDPRRDARPVELGHRLQPRARVRRVRFTGPPCLLVDRGHGEVRADVRDVGDLLHEIQVAQQQRRLGQDRARVGRIAQRLPDPPHELVAALDPLVRVGVGPHRDVLALPRRPRELDAQHLGHVDLDHDLLLEVAASVEVQVGVGWAGEAVKAGMAASAVGVDRPAEGHPRALGDAVERGLGADLVEAGVERLGGVEVAHDRRLAVAG